MDIARPFITEANSREIPYQVLGGLGYAALLEPETYYDIDRKEIIAPERLSVPYLRENGSPKDVDILVLSTSAESVSDVEQIAKDTIGNHKITVNVFNLHSLSQLKKMIDEPFSKPALTAALSGRYVDDDNSSGENDFTKAVFPFGVNAPGDSLETWHVISSKTQPIPVPHPAMMILNNATRSIAGIRPKYDSKVVRMVDNILVRDPEIISWMLDGPGLSHLTLAGVLRALGWKKIIHDPQPIKLSTIKNLSIQPPKVESLLEHPAFLLHDSPKYQQKLALSIARIRSSGLIGPVERHFQDFWERHNLESLFKNIVRGR